jgi:ribonuclease BN (tRNA processing enzyme)
MKLQFCFGAGLVFVLAATGAAGVAAQSVDPSRLPLGDGRVSSSPVRGSVWSCNDEFPGGGGAHVVGPWIRPDGTYDFTAKPTVDGAVTWPHQFRISLAGATRKLSGNDLPDHPTGVFPIGRGDDAFNYDRNPNSIQAQNFSLDMPANPAVAARSSCLPMGPIGALISGGYIFNALDLRGQDAVAHEIQDGCQGHPQMSGAYHYHNVSSCIDDPGTTHSRLLGYAFDGFGIFGKRGEGGRPLSNADLDECHGHTHDIEWDGRTISMYHYHATWEYPYTLGCFRGSPLTGGFFQGRRGGGPGGPAQQPAAAPPPTAASTFSVTTLGTGSPRTDSERAGPSNLIRIGERYIVVDAGNGVQARLMEAGITADRIDALLITHHHLDHDQELMPLLITMLVRGVSPQVIGAPGTVDMVNFMRRFYQEDIAYRMQRAPGADVDLSALSVRDVSGGEKFRIGAAEVATAEVQHTIHTVAYRFDVDGKSIVISGDLTYSPSLVELARGADVLVMDSGTLPAAAGEPAAGRGGRGGRAGRGGRGGMAGGGGVAGPPAGRGARGAQPPGQGQRAHPSLAEVASMASQAGVKCLVLTHIAQPSVDIPATIDAFRTLFAGKVIVARDGLEVAPESCRDAEF